MLAEAEDGKRGDFYAVVPIHEPGHIWDKILSALNPGRWARAFAGWMIEGTHGTLCGVIERASGEDGRQLRGRLAHERHPHLAPLPTSPTPITWCASAWMVVWAITTGALVVILGWMGLSLIVS